MNPPPRLLLDRHASRGVVQRVYETPVAIEVDAGTRYEISRRRVFFDEVRLVTLHRERGAGYLIGTALGTVVLSLLWLSLSREPGVAGAWRVYLFMWAITAFPLLIALLLRLALGVDVVTIQGRRTHAELRFPLRKQRAREVFHRLAHRARDAQAAPPG